MDDASDTGSHRHVTVSGLALRFPYSRLNDTLAGKAAIGFSAIRGEFDEIGTDPLVALLEIVAGPGSRGNV